MIKAIEKPETVNTQLHVHTLPKIQILRQATEIGYGRELSDYLYDTWESHNRKYFDGAIIPSLITPEKTAMHGNCFGYTSPHTNRISLHQRILGIMSNRAKKDPWEKTFGKDGDKYLHNRRFASDTLLHEMIHQFLNQEYPEYRDEKFSHNCDLWVNEINRIASIMGFKIKAQPNKRRRVNGKIVRTPKDGYLPTSVIQTFPLSLTEKGYYSGETHKRTQVKNTVCAHN